MKIENICCYWPTKQPKNRPEAQQNLSVFKCSAEETQALDSLKSKEALK